MDGDCEGRGKRKREPSKKLKESLDAETQSSNLAAPKSTSSKQGTTAIKAPRRVSSNVSLSYEKG